MATLKDLIRELLPYANRFNHSHIVRIEVHDNQLRFDFEDGKWVVLQLWKARPQDIPDEEISS